PFAERPGELIYLLQLRRRCDHRLTHAHGLANPPANTDVHAGVSRAARDGPSQRRDEREAHVTGRRTVEDHSGETGQRATSRTDVTLRRGLHHGHDAGEVVATTIAYGRRIR